MQQLPNDYSRELVLIHKLHAMGALHVKVGSVEVTFPPPGLAAPAAPSQGTFADEPPVPKNARLADHPAFAQDYDWTPARTAPEPEHAWMAHRRAVGTDTVEGKR